MELSARLERILFYVPSDAILADIGTDHALLPIAAVQRGKAKRAIATDKNAAPLEKAKENLVKSGVQWKIQLRQGEGLGPLFTGEATCIVIAGIGGTQMINILSTSRPVWANARLILQPNKDVEKLREWLYDEEVVLSTEALVRDRDRFFTILVCQRGPQHMREMAYHVPGFRPVDLHVPGPHLLREGGADVLAYLEQQVERQTKELAQIPEGEPAREEADLRLWRLQMALEHLQPKAPV